MTIYAVRQWGRTDNLTIKYRKEKQIDVSF